MAHDTTTPTDVPEQGAHYELTVCEHICYGPQGELLKFQRSSTEIGRQQASYLADARGCVLKTLCHGFTANGEEICDDSKQTMAAAARNMTAIFVSPCTFAHVLLRATQQQQQQQQTQQQTQQGAQAGELQHEPEGTEPPLESFLAGAGRGRWRTARLCCGGSSGGSMTRLAGCN